MRTYILYRDSDGSTVTGTFTVAQQNNGTLTAWIISQTALGYRQVSDTGASLTGPRGL